MKCFGLLLRLVTLGVLAFVFMVGCGAPPAPPPIIIREQVVVTATPAPEPPSPIPAIPTPVPPTPIPPTPTPVPPTPVPLTPTPVPLVPVPPLPPFVLPTPRQPTVPAMMLITRHNQRCVTAVGNGIAQSDCRGTSDQLWQIANRNLSNIVLQSSGRCLAIPGSPTLTGSLTLSIDLEKMI